MSDVQVPPNRRGRRAGATREEVLRLAMHRYLRGARVDVSELAAELELGRSTVYRWFSSRDELIGEVLVRAAEPLLERARADARGTGAAALGDALDRFNRSLVDAPALRRFIDREPEAAVRIIISSTGKVQPRIVELVTGLIRREVQAGGYRPAIDPATLGYSIVRLGEAFLFNDAVAGMRGDVDRLRDVQAALFASERAPDEGRDGRCEGVQTFSNTSR